MEDIPADFTTAEGKSIKSLDDLPEVAKLAERQRFLNKWYRPVALAPFVISIILGVGVFPNSTSPVLLGLVFASLFWAIFVAGYAFYLLVNFRCPACDSRFGLGDECKACALPRHADETSNLFTSLP
jgi:hypothetical protein